MSARGTPFATVRSEGGLLPPDLLARIVAGDARLPDLAPADYGLPTTTRLGEAAARAWTAAKTYWAAFTAGMAYAPAGDSGVSATREQWLLPLFQTLEYGRLEYRAAAEKIGDRNYAISHRAGSGEGAPPIHLVSYQQGLDDALGSGEARRISPHGLLQEYLNGTDHVWGIVSNGYTLRLLHDNLRLSRPTYVQFDLQAMFEGGVYADFVLLYLLLHRSRLPKGFADTASCPLSRWVEVAQRDGSRALEDLGKGVETAIKCLGSGFLGHPGNDQLRAALREGALSAEDYYREILRLVYRLLFLLVAEERELLFDETATPRQRQIYDDYYAVGRLRPLADGRRAAGDRHDDLWHGLGATFTAMRDGCGTLGLKPLGGGLFAPESCPHLDAASLGNTALLGALHGLSQIRAGKLVTRVNYRDMNVEELGSVYEGLLDYHPLIRVSGHNISFELGGGSERKTTGSYYTPDALVQELIKSALEPVIGDRLAEARNPRAALLGIRVCDPACGSGHFLLAAARKLARELARIDSGQREPGLRELDRARREVIRHCIYGVDLNPLAVDLCKLALWIEGHVQGTALAFLDHRIKCGNSLIGATPAIVEAGIPDEAYAAVTGDDKKQSSALKRRNKLEHTQRDQLTLFGDAQPVAADEDEVLEALLIDDLPDDNTADTGAKRARYEALAARLDRKRLVADVWAATFFWTLRDGEPQPPTQLALQSLRREGNPLRPDQLARVAQIVEQVRIFHWHLEYPEVFGEDGQGGFDCVLGNPPWERIKLQEEEFFTARDTAIASAQNKAARERLIKALAVRQPEDSDKEYERKIRLAAEFEAAKHAAEAQSKFVRQSARFPQTGAGDVNTYALFAEHFCKITGGKGRAGIICPTGVATDDTTKAFFGRIVNDANLASLVGFENEAFIFPAVHHSYRFCILTMTGSERPKEYASLCFFCRYIAQVQDPQRRFTLTRDDFSLLNPNTLTCPTFRTSADAELTRAIYRRIPVLLNERTGQNPWGVTFLRMFDMANDSGLFRQNAAEGLVPLYEAKLLHQYDHRWATYNGNEVIDITVDEKVDPCVTITPRYWVPQTELETRLADRWGHKWLLGFRDVCRSHDERTAIFAILPRVAVGHKAPLILPTLENKQYIACLAGNANSLVFDYIARQKLGGASMSYFILKQIPVLPPDRYTAADVDFIFPRVLELVYTAWDMQPFARDLGYAGPPFTWYEDRRANLRAELDAYFARLYGLATKQLRYILDPHSLTDRELADILDPAEDAPDAARTRDFPGETFRVLKEREMRQFGEYRTARLVLEAWASL